MIHSSSRKYLYIAYLPAKALTLLAPATDNTRLEEEDELCEGAALVLPPWEDTIGIPPLETPLATAATEELFTPPPTVTPKDTGGTITEEGGGTTTEDMLVPNTPPLPS
jgi:hypothetical protein